VVDEVPRRPTQRQHGDLTEIEGQAPIVEVPASGGRQQGATAGLSIRGPAHGHLGDAGERYGRLRERPAGGAPHAPARSAERSWAKSDLLPYSCRLGDAGRRYGVPLREGEADEPEPGLLAARPGHLHLPSLRRAVAGASEYADGVAGALPAR